MLTEAESKGLKSILEALNDDDIVSILETVTKGMFSTTIPNHAIEMILSSTAKPSDVLRRKKVTKKIIFNYLLKVGVPVTAELEKSKLISKCLELWNSGEVCNENDFSEMESENSPCQEDLSMGVSFSKWFFSMLWPQNLNTFGPQHFWPECTLQAQILTGSNMVKNVHLSGSDNVASFLSSLIMFDKFYFVPNDYNNDSILMELESHGLVKIVIKGIVHQNSNCVGLFDSAFGLVRNPLSENTYKIQLMKLLLHVKVSPPEILAGQTCFPMYQIAS